MTSTVFIVLRFNKKGESPLMTIEGVYNNSAAAQNHIEANDVMPDPDRELHWINNLWSMDIVYQLAEYPVNTRSVEAIIKDSTSLATASEFVAGVPGKYDNWS